MKRKLPLFALALIASGCTGVSTAHRSDVWSSPSMGGASTAMVRHTELPWFGETIFAQDPSNSDYAAETCTTPKMPLKPTGRGRLSGTVFVLDPGHGGKDTGSYWVETLEDGRQVAFWESAYSYAMTDTLSDMLRKEGAIVYLTAYSKLADEAIDGGINEPLPVPRDATFLWNQGSVIPKLGWWQRIHMGNDVYQRYKKTHKVVYLSVHVDAMDTQGWKGSHVLVKNKNKPPKIAKALAEQIEKGGYARTQNGEEKPLIDRTRDLFLFRKTQNPNTVLWEMALPQNEEDSLRMRDKESREAYAHVALDAAVEYAQSTH
ncbi:MAG: N-acetylmuramoyl-L-alanine amidase [Fimbriimonas sp.]